MHRLVIIWFSFIISLGEIIYFYINLENHVSDMLIFTFSFIIFISFGIIELLKISKEEKEKN